MNWIKDILNHLYITLGLALGFFSDDPDDANFKIIGVIFDIPQSSDVMIGEPIQATVTYTSDLKGKPFQIWVYPASDEFGGTYQASGMEPASGKVTRCFEVSSIGHLTAIEVYVQHHSGETICEHIKNVDFHFVENPERELLKQDGEGAHVNITKVLMDGFALNPNGRIPVGQDIEVEVSYQHNAEHAVSLWARPYAQDECAARYSSGEMPDKKQGKVTKCFEVIDPVTIDGIYVIMTNVADEVIAEHWLEFPIEFYAR